MQGLHKFLSHKSRTRLLKLALMRADVPVMYTQGFNPRISIIYCPSSPVGVFVENDYFIVKCRFFSKESLSLDLLNNSLPTGVRVKDVSVLENKALKVNASLIAVYNIKIFQPSYEIEEKIDDMLAREEIILTRKGKKDKNIRALIHKVLVIEKGKESNIEGHFYAGEGGHLSPVDFLRTLLKKEKNEFLHFVDIGRKGFYYKESKEYV